MGEARLGDRVPALGQGRRAVGRDGQAGDEAAGPVAVVGDHLIAVVPFGEDDLLPRLRGEELEVDGERPLPDLHRHRLLGPERAVDPLLLLECCRVPARLVEPSGGVLDDGEQPILGLRDSSIFPSGQVGRGAGLGAGGGGACAVVATGPAGSSSSGAVSHQDARTTIAGRVSARLHHFRRRSRPAARPDIDTIAAMRPDSLDVSLIGGLRPIGIRRRDIRRVRDPGPARGRAEGPAIEDRSSVSPTIRFVNRPRTISARPTARLALTPPVN